MTEKATKRSGMLGAIYKMLPNIDDDYAAKLVYTLENKKTLQALQQDIADFSAQLGEGSPAADTIVAKMLLDEITLPAALRQLRIYNNAASVAELAAALGSSEEETELGLNYYASFASERFFDVEFAKSLQDVRDDASLSDEEKARHGFNALIKAARQDAAANARILRENKQAVCQTADKLRLPLKITAALLAVYTAPGAEAFQPRFDALMKTLEAVNPDAALNASLAAKTLLCRITQKDAQDITLTSKLLGGRILEEDLMIIACRYLKTKTPGDILDAFDAVLQKLPHVSQKEENLSLAVQVLLDGTEQSFETARRKAALRRERILLCKALSKKEIYAGYEYDIAQRFAGQKTYMQLEREMNELLLQLPYCQEESENKELACKVLLGALSLDEATKQAVYLRDLKAKTLTKGLAPRALKNYLGTKSPEEIIAFFEKSLAPYTFWKSDRAKHEFALSALVGELNGTSDGRISAFALDKLESGSSLELVGDMLNNILAHKADPAQVEALMDTYAKARPAGLQSRD